MALPLLAGYAQGVISKSVCGCYAMNHRSIFATAGAGARLRNACGRTSPAPPRYRASRRGASNERLTMTRPYLRTLRCLKALMPHPPLCRRMVLEA